MSPEQEFEQRFQEAVTHMGPSYVIARSALVEKGSVVRPWLEARTQDSDWHRARVAEFILAWIDHGTIFPACDTLLGTVRVPGERKMISSNADRIAAVRALGESTRYRLLEIVYKEAGFSGSQKEYDTALQGVRALFDPLPSNMLAEVMQDVRRSMDTRIAMASLLQTSAHDPRVEDFAKTVAFDQNAAEMDRRIALTLLASLDACEVLPDIRTMMMSLESNSALRMAAATTLGQFGDTKSVTPMLQLLRESNDQPLRMHIISVLGNYIGEQNTLDVLLAIIQQDSTNEAVQTQAQDAIREIQRRLQQPSP